jgi:hypothetical protein
MRSAEIAVPATAAIAFQVKPCIGPLRGGASRESVAAFDPQTPIRTGSGGGTRDFVTWLAADRVQGANARTLAGSCA